MPSLQCARPLPNLLHLGQWRADLYGCSASLQETAWVVTFVVSIVSNKGVYLYEGFRMARQRLWPNSTTFEFSLDGVPCATPARKLHAVEISCKVAGRQQPRKLVLQATVRDDDHSRFGVLELGVCTGRPIYRTLDLKEGERRCTRSVRRPGNVVSDVGWIALEGKLSHLPAGGALHCAGNAIYGNFSREYELWRVAPTAWRAAGFLNSYVFTRDAEQCQALEKLPGVICQERGIASNITYSMTQFRFDQVIHMQLCLLYAQAAQLSLLVFADVDDLPSTGINVSTSRLYPAVQEKSNLFVSKLQEVIASGHAGIGMFFDSMRVCPVQTCPSSYAAMLTLCDPLPGVKGIQSWWWKPVVVPARCDDIQSPHAIVPREGFKALQQVWDPCLWHVRNPAEYCKKSNETARWFPHKELMCDRFTSARRHAAHIHQPKIPNTTWCHLSCPASLSKVSHLDDATRSVRRSMPTAAKPRCDAGNSVANMKRNLDREGGEFEASALA